MDTGGAQREDVPVNKDSHILWREPWGQEREELAWGGGASLKDCFIGFSSMACSVTLSAISSMQLPVKSTLGTGTVGLGIVL